MNCAFSTGFPSCLKCQKCTDENSQWAPYQKPITKPLTNRDRLHTMSDEELFYYLGCKCCAISPSSDACSATDCRVGIITWLNAVAT